MRLRSISEHPSAKNDRSLIDENPFEDILLDPSEAVETKTARKFTFPKIRMPRISFGALPLNLFRFQKKFMIFCAALTGLVMIVVGFQKNIFNFSRRAAPSFALFEVKAIDPSGRPIAGATVINDQTRVGITDSFGEWRRFLKVQPGSTVGVSVSKKIGGNKLSATKNFAVPIEAESGRDIEFRATVQLVKDDVEPKVVEKSSEKIIQVNKKEAATLKENSARPEASVELVTIQIARSTQQNANPAIAKIISAMAGAAGQNGFKVVHEAPYILTIESVESAKDQSLLLVKVFNKERNVEQHFLKNILEDANATAAIILRTFKSFSEKTVELQKFNDRWLLTRFGSGVFQPYPGMTLVDRSGQQFVVQQDTESNEFYLNGKLDCEETTCAVRLPNIFTNPPVQGWQKQQLRVQGAFGSGDQLFVSGYPARKLRGDTWEYWGGATGKANVTILRGRSVTSRMQIDQSKKIALISIPMSPISKK